MFVKLLLQQIYYNLQLVLILLVFAVLTISCVSNDNEDLTNFIRNKEIITNWQFQIDIFDIGENEKWFSPQYDKQEWSTVSIPGSWNTYEDALWGYEGVGWYCAEIPEEFVSENKIVRLKFNRVNYYSKVWLNGVFIGENIGGYLPFEIDVSDIINRNSTNCIVVRVDNKPRIEWLPAGKQIEWVQYGGILGDVELIETDSIYLTDVTINALPKKDCTDINCSIKIMNRKQGVSIVKLSLGIPLETGDIKKVINVQCAANSITDVDIQLNVTQLKRWTLASPELYNLKVDILDSSMIYANAVFSFGIRSIKTDGHQILLNDQPLQIKGVNRYDIFNRQGHIIDEQIIREDLLKIKQTGANTIRVHYPQSPMTLRLLDEIGLLLIEELPLNWWGQNWWDDEKVIQDTGLLKQASVILDKMIRRDKNHPSIIAWSLANESKTDTEVGSYVLNKLIQEARSLDSTRLITFAVNDESNKYLAFEQADIVCCNVYYGNDKAFHEVMLDSLVRLPSEDYIKRQCNYYPDKPVLVTEFGAAGIYGIYGDLVFSEDYQANYIEKVWEAITNVSQCSGGILWCWSDYYHRKYFTQTYAPFGPYGVMNDERKPKRSFETLCNIFDNEN